MQRRGHGHQLVVLHVQYAQLATAAKFDGEGAQLRRECSVRVKGRRRAATGGVRVAHPVARALEGAEGSTAPDVVGQLTDGVEGDVHVRELVQAA